MNIENLKTKLMQKTNISLDLQLEAVEANGCLIEHINNPCLTVQMAAVKQNGLAIQFIKNPTSEIEMLAFHQNYNAIQYIKNPSVEMQMTVVHENCNNIRLIRNPSHKVKKFAIEQGCSLIYIKEQNDELQLLAVQRDGLQLQFVEYPNNVSFAVIEAAIKQNHKAMEFVENKYNNLQIKLIKININTIRYIENPSKEVQLYVMEKEQKMFPAIKNPCEEARIIFIKSLKKFGEFVELKVNEDICKGCRANNNNKCFYKFSNGLFDGCPRFLEHIALKKDVND